MIFFLIFLQMEIHFLDSRSNFRWKFHQGFVRNLHNDWAEIRTQNSLSWLIPHFDIHRHILWNQHFQRKIFKQKNSIQHNFKTNWNFEGRKFSIFPEKNNDCVTWTWDMTELTITLLNQIICWKIHFISWRKIGKPVASIFYFCRMKNLLLFKKKVFSSVS